LLNVLGLGDNVCDIYFHSKTMYPGGQALNFAVYAARLGSTAEYMGAFGNDAMAAHIMKTLDELGVGRSHCRQYDEENGYAVVRLMDGDREFIGSNKGGPLWNHPIVLTEEELAYISGFDIVHTSDNSYIDAQLPKLAELPCLVSYDFSVRWEETDRVKRVSPYIDFAFASFGDRLRAENAEEICRWIHSHGADVAVCTMGKLGSLLFDGENMIRQPVNLVTAVDSLGAGDSYAACVVFEAAQAMKADLEKWKHSAPHRKEFWLKALPKAAAFAGENCMVNGAFGFGVPAPDSIWDNAGIRKGR
jgi:sugar/nucleoside kinase (ribokinase family)